MFLQIIIRKVNFVNCLAFGTWSFLYQFLSWKENLRELFERKCRTQNPFHSVSIPTRDCFWEILSLAHLAPAEAGWQDGSNQSLLLMLINAKCFSRYSGFQINRLSRRERGMASIPLFIILDFFCIFQTNFATTTLGLKEMGKFLWEGREKGLPCWLSQWQSTGKTFFHFLQN